MAGAHVRPKRQLLSYWLLGALFCLLLLGIQLAWMAKLPYSTSILEDVAVAAPTLQGDRSLTLGQLAWDVSEYRHDPVLKPLRDYYQANRAGKTGLEAALLISDRMVADFPFGPPSREFFQVHYDPVAALWAHRGGEPGHCVTRAALLTSILLSGGAPARVVQLLPPDGRGHTLVEVLDPRHGWSLVDPSTGGIIGNQRGPCSAIEAQRSPDSVRWLGGAKAATRLIDPLEFYQGKTATAFRGHLIYPEPWLYMRRGVRTSSWPYRGRFVHVGPRQWEFGPGHTALKYGVMACALLALLCGWMATARRYPAARTRRGPHAELACGAE